jgi:hypothetical protein
MYLCVGVVYLFPTIIMKSIQRRVVSVKKSSYFHEFALQNMKRACDCDRMYTRGLDAMTGMVCSLLAIFLLDMQPWPVYFQWKKFEK